MKRFIIGSCPTGSVELILSWRIEDNRTVHSHVTWIESQELQVNLEREHRNSFLCRTLSTSWGGDWYWAVVPSYQEAVIPLIERSVNPNPASCCWTVNKQEVTFSCEEGAQLLGLLGLLVVSVDSLRGKAWLEEGWEEMSAEGTMLESTSREPLPHKLLDPE